MQNVIRLLQKYRVAFLFAFLQVICFVLILAGNNPFHRASFASSSNYFVATLNDWSNSVTGYFRLGEELEQSQDQVSELQKLVYGKDITLYDDVIIVDDTSYQQHYEYSTIRIINSQFNSRNNYVTINKGLNDGLEPTMGVIGSKGVVGYTIANSAHYSTVMPLINPKAKTIFVRHQKSGVLGELKWIVGTNTYQDISVEGVVVSRKIEEGDVFVTSGANGIFPEGVLVGNVKKAEVKEGKGDYDLILNLTEPFDALYHGTVVKNLYQKEQLELEQKLDNEGSD